MIHQQHLNLCWQSVGSHPKTLPSEATQMDLGDTTTLKRLQQLGIWPEKIQMLWNAIMASVEPETGPLKVGIPDVLQICHRQTKCDIFSSISGFLSIMTCSDNFRGLRNTFPIFLHTKNKTEYCENRLFTDLSTTRTSQVFPLVWTISSSLSPTLAEIWT